MNRWGAKAASWLWSPPGTLCLVAAVLFCAAFPEPVAAAAAARASARPNIVFILADDLGYGDLRSEHFPMRALDSSTAP